MQQVRRTVEIEGRGVIMIEELWGVRVSRAPSNPVFHRKHARVMGRCKKR
jgi:hypothetical protein